MIKVDKDRTVISGSIAMLSYEITELVQMIKNYMLLPAQEDELKRIMRIYIPLQVIQTRWIRRRL